jgi:hypothetical protein
MALEAKGRNQREFGKKMQIFPLSDIASEFSSSTGLRRLPEKPVEKFTEN